MLSIRWGFVVPVVASLVIAGCGGTTDPDPAGNAGTGGGGTGGIAGAGGTGGEGGGGGDAGSGGSGGSAGAGGTGGSAGEGGSGGSGGAGGSGGPICGDGTVEGTEECDDGNTAPDDGCSPTCLFEATCGNGVIEGLEACDGADLGGATCADFGHNSGALACSAACALDASACTTVEFCGNGVDDDGDTLADCDDEDCASEPTCPRCGDGAINHAGEDCDGEQVPLSCTDLGYASGTTSCTEFCLVDTAGCIPPEDCATPGDEDRDGAADCDDEDCTFAFTCPACGNGVIQQGEECEGSVPPATTCATYGFDAGTLACDPVNCVVDTQHCVHLENCSVPGDEDGDGDADCADSECAQRPPCPVCGNGVVEAGESCDDGNTANGDGCSQWCRTAEPIPTAGNTMVFLGGLASNTPTWARPNTNDSTFVCSAGTTQKRFHTYRLQNQGTLPARIKVSVTAERAYGSLYIYRGTFDPLQPMGGCFGKSGGSTTASVTWFLDNYAIAPGEIVTVVISDGTQVNYPLVDYTLTVETRSICGDALVSGNEPCDDGNTTTGDGCSDVCARETGWACNPYDTPQCHTTVCGDSILEGDEQCDDGNTVEGDFCGATCVRAGVSCTAPMYMINKWDPAQASWIWSGTTDFLPDHTASCASSNGPDGIASFTAPTTGDYYFSYYARNFSGVLVLWSGTCGQASSEVACIPPATGSYQTTTRHMVAGETVFVGIDGTASSTAYQFTLLIKRFTCGNGLVESPAESCDDFNAVNGDGCSSVCALETYEEIEPNDTLTDAKRLNGFRLAHGAISPVGDVDLFSFVGLAGTPYRVTVFHTALDQCYSAFLGRGDPILTIYDANGVQVAQHDNISITQLCSDLTFTPTATGNFYAEVRSAAPNASIADYYLKIR